jgi:hypothetical protein
MKRTGKVAIAAVAVVVLCGFTTKVAHAAGGSAQAGGYITSSFPTGDWGDVAGFGLGLENATVVYPDSVKPFGIRQGASLIFNFGKTIDIPASQLNSNNTSLQLDTHNTALWLGIGPEIAKHTGNARPFLYGTAGVTFNWIGSKLTGDVESQGYSAVVGQTSTTFTWTAGAGISKPMASGARFELSAEYRSNTSMSYLLPGSVTSQGSDVTWDRTNQAADQFIIRIGIVESN